MVDCDYCSASFEDEESYLEHLGEAHEGELGAIDRRRVEGTGDDSSLPVGVLVLGFVGVVSLGLIAAVFFLTSGSGGGSETINGIQVDQTPTDLGAAHYHGVANVTVLGDRIDFSQSEYQLQADPFHFESGEGVVWHGHAQGVTLEYAMATLGIGVTESSVTFQGETYSDDDPEYDVRVTVNGESVDPSSYELAGTSAEQAQQGDRIRIVVRRTG